jgi:putative ABC transport system ATP-binding protein
MAKKNTKQASLVLNDIAYSYNGVTGEDKVLKNISAEFESGKMYAIVGESGSGKTTLLTLIAGLDALQEGDIQCAGKSISEIGESKYRLKYVNVVFQSFNLIKYMTARENVEVVLDFAGHHDRGLAYAALEKVGLNREEADRLVMRLSGGQQQRVAIARALASNVPIVVADEPTGNLDEDTEEKIIGLFRSLARDEGKIVIIVTHSKQVASAADVKYRLRKGVLTVER